MISLSLYSIIEISIQWTAIELIIKLQHFLRNPTSYSEDKTYPCQNTAFRKLQNIWSIHPNHLCPEGKQRPIGCCFGKHSREDLLKYHLSVLRYYLYHLWNYKNSFTQTCFIDMERVIKNVSKLPHVTNFLMVFCWRLNLQDCKSWCIFSEDNNGFTHTLTQFTSSLLFQVLGQMSKP
jgi:hypothetical protein